MVKIIDNQELEVTKLSNKVKFSIKKNKFGIFYEKIKNILGVKTNQFSINARNFIGLNDLIETNNFLYKHADVLFQTLFLQIKELEKNNLGILYLNLSDIYFIDVNDNKFYFLLLKTNKIHPIKNKMIELSQPIKKKDGLFFSPELKNQKTFPSQISLKSVYYSLAMITIHSLKKIKGKLNLHTHIESLVGTPLYWALERCLMDDPENRTLLYI